MSMGGTQQTGSSTSTQTPPAYMYPYIGTALDQAGNLLQTGGPSYYPGQPVAGFSDPQQEAMGAIDTLASTGTTAGNAATGYDANLLTGNFSGPQAALARIGQGGAGNPYLDAMFKQAAGATQNRLASEFAGAGRNVSASEPLRAEELNNLATHLYGGAYAQDQANALGANQALGSEQQNALAEAPSLDAMQFGNLGQEMNVGGLVQNQAQKLIDASRDAFNYSQQQPWQNLSSYEALLSGVQPGSSQTNPILNNPAANTANVATALAALMKAYAAA